MKKYMFIALLLISRPALAEVFKVDGVRMQFTTNKAKRITANEVCQKKKACDAFKVLRKLSMDSISADDLFGGANPGPILCEQQAQGEVVMGEDEDFNQNSFCKFKDGSIIDNGTLTYYGIKNDRMRKSKKK